MNPIVEELRLLELQERIEKLIDLIYSEGRDSLSTREYLQVLDLTDETLSKVGIGEDFSLGEDLKWHSETGPWTMTSFSVYEIQEDERDDFFSENFTPDRYTELSNGSEPTANEKQQYKEYLLKDLAEGDTDSLNQINLYQLFDSQNRSIRFRQEVGDGGEIIITDGPLIDLQDDLDGFENSLFVPYHDDEDSEDWEE